MNEKQKRFADYYIELGNAEQAALKAGYSQTYSRAQSYKLLANVGIKQYIDSRLKTLEDKRIMDAEEAMRILTSIARNEEQEDVVVFGENGPEITSKGMSAKDRLKALELIGKRYTLWTDKQQLEGNIGVTIVDDIDD